MDIAKNAYLKLKSINVNERKEKRGQYDYLSWADAVDYLLTEDPNATWEYRDPTVFPNGTMMVYCSVTAFGKTMTAQLAVMNHLNKDIQNPGAVDVNKAMQRCLVKAIALHGLGLYIYQGEDLPESDEDNKDIYDDIDRCMTVEDIRQAKIKHSNRWSKETQAYAERVFKSKGIK